MTRYTPSGQVTTIPQNQAEFEKIQTAINDTLSRKGDTPNGMEADLDMNSNKIFNLPEPTTATEPLRLGDEVDVTIITGTETVIRADNVAAMTLLSQNVGDVIKLDRYVSGGILVPDLEYEVVASGGSIAADGYVHHTMANGNIAALRAAGSISVLQAGAMPANTASTDYTLNIQAALNSGFKGVYFPAGEYGVGGDGLVVPNNTKVYGEGVLKLVANIPASSWVGVVRFDTVSNSEWRLDVDVSGIGAFDNTVIDVRNCTDCFFKDHRIVDNGVSRYPLGPYRSRDNVRCRWQDIHATNIGDGFMQCQNDTYCHYTGLTMVGGSHTGLDTTSGEHNVIVNNITECTSNTAFSGLSFNDKWSVCASNVVQGGAYSITGGHVGRPIDYSVVSANAMSDAAQYGFQIQASTGAAITGNAIDGENDTGIFNESNSKFNTFAGNAVSGTWSVGMRLGSHSVGVGNVSVGSGTGYRNAVDNVPALYVGNIAANGTGVGFDWGIAASQSENIVVGNMAVDDQGTATQTIGFRSLSATNNFVGNATDGNHVTSEFSGTYSTAIIKDTSDTAAKFTPVSDATTGAAAAATGSVDLAINGVTYSVLYK